MDADPWHREKDAHIIAGILYERPWAALSEKQREDIRHCVDTIDANYSCPACGRKLRDGQ